MYALDRIKLGMDFGYYSPTYFQTRCPRARVQKLVGFCVCGEFITHLILMPIKTKVVSSKPIHGEVYSMQHYVIKFVSDLRQVDGYLGYSGFLHQ